MAVKLTREGQPRRKQDWHRDYAACVICGTMIRPHHSGGRCTDCARGRAVGAANGAPDTTDKKYCTGCERWKGYGAFDRDKATKDGYRHRCQSCRRPKRAASNRRWYAANKDALARVREENRALFRAQARANYRRNVQTYREINRLRMREYRREHGTELNARRRAQHAAKRAEQHREAA